MTCCATFEKDPKHAKKIEQFERIIEAEKSNTGYQILDQAYINKQAVNLSPDPLLVLKNKYISLTGNNIPFFEILKEFEAVGVQVITPLSNMGHITYNGYKIHKTDAKTALNILTTSLGLDYFVKLDALNNPVVTITGLAPESFTFNLPAIQSQGFDLKTDQSQNNSGGGSEKSEAKNIASIEKMAHHITVSSSFWNNLQTELEAMLTEYNPIAQRSSQYSTQYSTQHNLQYNTHNDFTNSDSNFKPVKSGSITINPDSGRVTVIAPRHIRNRVIGYLKELNAKLNTRIIIEGRLLAVTTQNTETRGIDWSDFNQFANEKYNVFSANPIMGQSSVNISSDISKGFSGAFSNSLTGSLVGLQVAENSFNAFSAYLSKDNSVSTLNVFSDTTYSGVPIKITNLSDNISFNYSQGQTVTGVAGTSGGGVTKERVNDQTGSLFQITPIYDLKSGIIRTYSNITLILKKGVIKDETIITTAQGTERIPTETIERATITFQPKSLSRSGETLILSSNSSSIESINSQGMTKAKDSFLGGLVGHGKRSLSNTRYYLLVNIRAEALTHAL